MKLMQVAAGKFVHLPPQLVQRQRGKARIWLEAGDVIDMSDTFIVHCLAGQEYKLIDAPKGATLTEKRHGLVEAYRRELSRKTIVPENPKREAAVQVAKQEGLLGTEGEPGSGGVPPEPDLDPTPKKAGKQGKN